MIYISEATASMSTEELGVILETSRANNQRDGITGMLLYIERQSNLTGGRFMQVLEGEKEELQKALNRIRTDVRHRNVMLISEDTLVQRNFNSWSMGFKSLKADDFTLIPGYINITDSKVLMRKLKGLSKPVNYLKSFYQMNQELNIKK